MLACGAAFDVFLHELHETWPPEFGSNELTDFKITGVAGSFMVMAAGKDGAVEGVLRGNVDVTFVGQDMVIEFPIQEVGLEGSRNVLQGCLQVLENEGIGFGRVANALV